MKQGKAPPQGLSDLHRHLDGSLRLETTLSLARELDVKVPDPLTFHPGMGITRALERFRFTLSLLKRPEAIRRVSSELCEDAATDGVTTLEVRFAPQLHAPSPIDEAIDAALEGLSDRAGLILCGLYGEPPDLLGELVELGAPRPGVVGLDLAGAPLPEHRYRIEDYADAFLEAGRRGLGRTVHAGEGRPVHEIVIALERLGADRIGHGVTLLDDPRAQELVLDRGVTVEACLTSNLQTGAVSQLEDHPLPRWLRSGINACLCTDNTLFSMTTSSRELALARKLPGMNEAFVAQAIRCGHQAAFRR